jgi:hypothetical protein
VAARKMGNHAGLPLQFDTILRSTQFVSGYGIYDCLTAFDRVAGEHSIRKFFDELIIGKRDAENKKKGDSVGGKEVVFEFMDVRLTTAHFGEKNMYEPGRGKRHAVRENSNG